MPSSQTITSFYSFSALTTIRSGEVNTNFSAFRGHLIPVDPNTATAAATMTYDLGSIDHMWRGNYAQYGIMYANTSGSVPTVPTTTAYGLYFKNDGNLYKRNSSGTETQVDQAATTITSSYEISNLTIATSAASSALTIAIKTQSGSDASSGDPIKVAMRSATLTSGVYNQRSITGALSMTLSSGSTLGQTSGQAARVYVYLIDNAGTLEVAVSQTLYRENGVVSTTAEGGAGGADSGFTMYSTTARSNVPYRLVGFIDNTQSTAGTWASAGTMIQVGSYAALSADRPVARYTVSGAQTPGANQPIDHASKIFDSHNYVTTGSAWKFRPAISGIYKVKVFGSTFSGTPLYTAYKNGASGPGLTVSTVAQASVSGDALIPLLGGEYVDVRLDQNLTTGGNTAYNYIDISYEGPYAI